MKNSLGRKVVAASLAALLLLATCYGLLARDLSRWAATATEVMCATDRALLDGQFQVALSRAVGETVSYAIKGGALAHSEAQASFLHARQALAGLKALAQATPAGQTEASARALVLRQERLLQAVEQALQRATQEGPVLLNAKGSSALARLQAFEEEGDALWAEIAAHHRQERLRHEGMLLAHGQHAQSITLAGLAAFTLAIVVMVYFMRRRIVQPITALAGLTGKVAGGDLTVRSEVAPGSEIGQLQASFNAMVGDLSARRAERLAMVQEMARSRDVAQSANRAKSEFLANVSHELRTPLHGVLVSLDLMNETTTEPGQQRLVEVAAGSARSLLGMVNDLLGFSRLDAGRLRVEVANYEPRTVFGRVVSLCLQRAERKGLKLVCTVADDVPQRLCGDAARVSQGVMNLLDNALKFTERGAVEVKVSVLAAAAAPGTVSAAAPSPGPWLRIAVADTGPGISTEVQRQIARPFFRAELGGAPDRAGLGLGLGIVRQLAGSMGGELGFESEPGCGSNFWFTVRLMPEAACEAVAPPRPAQVQPLPAGAAVLLVDDQHDIREVVPRTLRRRGLTVQTADNGRSALGLVRHGHFDMVLMDCRMPVMDGFEAVREIRALPGAAARVPVVAVTAFGLTEPKQRYLDAGFDDLLVKPYSLEELEAMLRNWLAAPRPAHAAGGAG